MTSAEIHRTRWRAGRSGVTPTLIVVHDSEGPYGPTAAESLKRWMGTDTSASGNFASYHAITDSDSLADCVNEEDTAFGAGGVNQRALHWCITGAAAAGKANSIPYPDYLSTVGGRLGIAEVARWCVLYRIPAVHLTPAQVRDGAPGICGHGDVSVYHPTSGGHTDPGSRFPWHLFIDSVRAIVNPPAPQPPPSEDTVPGELIAVNDHPSYPTTTSVVYVTDGVGIHYRWVRSEADLAAVKADRAARGWPTTVTQRSFHELGRYGVLVGPAP